MKYTGLGVAAMSFGGMGYVGRSGLISSFNGFAYYNPKNPDSKFPEACIFIASLKKKEYSLLTGRQ